MDFVTDFESGHGKQHFMRRVNLLAANLLDDVSGLHAGLFGGGVRQSFADDHAVIDVKLLS